MTNAITIAVEALAAKDTPAGPWRAIGPHRRGGNREFYLVGRYKRGAWLNEEILRTPSNRQHRRFYSLEAAETEAGRLNAQ